MSTLKNTLQNNAAKTSACILMTWGLCSNAAPDSVVPGPGWRVWMLTSFLLMLLLLLVLRPHLEQQRNKEKYVSYFPKFVDRDLYLLHNYFDFLNQLVHDVS